MIGYFNRSLAARGLLPLILMLTVAGVLAFLGISRMTQGDIASALDQKLELATSTVAGAARNPLWELDQEGAKRALGMLGVDVDYHGSVLYDAEGKVFARHGSADLDGDGLVTNTLPITYERPDGAERIGSVTVTFSAARMERVVAEREVNLAIVCLVVLVLVCGVMVFLQHRLIKPIVAMTHAMTRLAKGDLEVAIPARNRTDEIGSMASAVATFKENAVAKARFEEGERVRIAEDAERTRESDLAHLSSTFESDVLAVLQEVDRAAKGMQQSAQQMLSLSDETAKVSQSATDIASEVSSNVQTVGAAVEEFTASLREIESLTKNSRAAAVDAVTRSKTTVQVVNGLVETAQRINDVVKLISDIAGKTNLLALNATIEAARAGDAGKGFAVVAGEVKQLAGQTAKATEEITKQISAIQLVTGQAAKEIQEIVVTIERVSEFADEVTSAVGDQQTASSSIGDAISGASHGMSRLEGDVTTVSGSARKSHTAAATSLEAVDTMNNRFNELKQRVNHFVSEITATRSVAR